MSEICHCGKQFDDEYDRAIHARSCQQAIYAIIDGKAYPTEDSKSEQLRDYEAALEFYADRKSYNIITRDLHQLERPAVLSDDGKLGRETLAKWRKK